MTLCERVILAPVAVVTGVSLYLCVAAELGRRGWLVIGDVGTLVGAAGSFLRVGAGDVPLDPAALLRPLIVPPSRMSS